MDTKVAFIGLGKMGAAIASNIAKAGIDLTVWNRSPDKCAPLAALGAKVAQTPADAVRNADVVITSLMDDRSILDMVTAENGILAGLRPGSVHACVTTISPEVADQLAKLHSDAGSRYVAAPVVGRPDAAAAGKLVSYLAGESDAIQAVMPIAETYSSAVHAMPGRAGAANSLKLAINYTAISMIEFFGEAFNFAEASGIDPKILGDFYDTVFKHQGILYYAHKIRDREFDSGAGFAMTAGLKDVTLMLEAASKAGVQLEIGEIASRKLKASIEQGKGEQDWSAITELARISPRTQA